MGITTSSQMLSNTVQCRYTYWCRIIIIAKKVSVWIRGSNTYIHIGAMFTGRTIKRVEAKCDPNF